jgi:hypothetical protein
MKRHGCDCQPTVDHLPADHVRRAGAVVGLEVRHTAGCPLGNRFVPANRLGIVPAVWTAGVRAGCER